MNLREEIRNSRNAADVPPTPFPAPEWPNVSGQLFLRVMTPREVDLLFAGVGEGETDFRAPFVSHVLCDANGVRVLSDEDAEWLAFKELPVIERAYQMGREINGLTEENRKGVQKNSGGTAEGGSPSSSAAPSTPVTAST